MRKENQSTQRLAIFTYLLAKWPVLPVHSYTCWDHYLPREQGVLADRVGKQSYLLYRPAAAEEGAGAILLSTRHT